MGFPAGDEFLVVVASFGVLAGDLGESDGVDGPVDLAVPAAVESVSHHSPGTGFEGCGTVGHGEFVFGGVPVGVSDLGDDGGGDQHTDPVDVTAGEFRFG